MLTNKTLQVEEVAVASEFTSATLLGVVFHRHVGESPTTFRHRNAITMPNRATLAARP